MTLFAIFSTAEYTRITHSLSSAASPTTVFPSEKLSSCQRLTFHRFQGGHSEREEIQSRSIARCQYISDRMPLYTSHDSTFCYVAQRNIAPPNSSFHGTINNSSCHQTVSYVSVRCNLCVGTCNFLAYHNGLFYSISNRLHWNVG